MSLPLPRNYREIFPFLEVPQKTEAKCEISVQFLTFYCTKCRI